MFIEQLIIFCVVSILMILSQTTTSYFIFILYFPLLFLWYIYDKLQFYIKKEKMKKCECKKLYGTLSDKNSSKTKSNKCFCFNDNYYYI